MKIENIEFIDIFEWDGINWAKSIKYWNKYLENENINYKCLELGANLGGFSLWLASLGNAVICSDIDSPEDKASQIHKKYFCHRNIRYEAIDATNISYTNYFDIIIFKSILGGICVNDEELRIKTINEIYKALKPGGKLLFAENLRSTNVHMFTRNLFLKRKKLWNYLKYKEVNLLFDSFEQLNYTTVGFLGAFGRTEWQRFFLGKIDNLIESFIPKSARYIIIGIAVK
jgi:SAM-dependent methyltransferase